MIKAVHSSVALLAAITLACGGSATAPAPTGPGGEAAKPPQVVSEVYEFPTGVIVDWDHSTNRTVQKEVPAGCLRAELKKINPGRDSILPWDYQVELTIVVRMCAEMPLVQNRGFVPQYTLVDEAGNKVTPWLATGTGELMPGKSREDWLATKVYVDLPPRIYGIKVHWVTQSGNSPVYSNYSSNPSENPPISVVMPLNWRFGGRS